MGHIITRADGQAGLIIGDGGCVIACLAGRVKVVERPVARLVLLLLLGVLLLEGLGLLP